MVGHWMYGERSFKTVVSSYVGGVLPFNVEDTNTIRNKVNGCISREQVTPCRHCKLTRGLRELSLLSCNNPLARTCTRTAEQYVWCARLRHTCAGQPTRAKALLQRATEPHARTLALTNCRDVKVLSIHCYS